MVDHSGSPFLWCNFMSFLPLQDWKPISNGGWEALKDEVFDRGHWWWPYRLLICWHSAFPLKHWPVLGELGTFVRLNTWCLRSARICSHFMLRYNLLHGPWINLRWDHCYLARGIAGTFQSSPFHAQRIVGPLEKMSHFTLDPTSQNEHCRDARNKNDSVYRCPCLEHFNVFHII